MREVIEINGKKVGWIENEVFFKKVKASKHLFKLYNGWSIAVSILDLLKERNIKLISIFDSESKKTYKSTLDNFIKLGHELWVKDYEPQICLNLNNFMEEK